MIDGEIVWTTRTKGRREACLTPYRSAACRLADASYATNLQANFIMALLTYIWILSTLLNNDMLCPPRRTSCVSQRSRHVKTSRAQISMRQGRAAADLRLNEVARSTCLNMSVRSSQFMARPSTCMNLPLSSELCLCVKGASV